MKKLEDLEDVFVMPRSRIAKRDSGKEADKLVQLIRTMAAGKQDALAAFYDRTRCQVYGLVERILKDAALAEEVTIDVYLQVWRDAAGYREERGSPLAWLITLARSRAIDRLRALKTERQRRQEQEPDWEDDITSNAQLISNDSLVDDWAADAERARYVHGALAQLGPEQRQALMLAYFEGLSHGEIAERLATPLGTVKTRIRTALQRLQALLSPCLGKEL